MKINQVIDFNLSSNPPYDSCYGEKFYFSLIFLNFWIDRTLPLLMLHPHWPLFVNNKLIAAFCPDTVPDVLPETVDGNVPSTFQL